MLVFLDVQDWADLLGRPEGGLWTRFSRFIGETESSVGLSFSLIVELAAARKTPAESIDDIRKCTSLPHKWLASDLAYRELEAEAGSANGGPTCVKAYVDSFADTFVPTAVRQRSLVSLGYHSERRPYSDLDKFLDTEGFNPRAEKMRLGRDVRYWRDTTLQAVREEFGGQWKTGKHSLFVRETAEFAGEHGTPGAEAWAEGIWSDPRSCPSYRLDFEMMLHCLQHRGRSVNSNDRLDALHLSYLPYCDAVTADGRFLAYITVLEKEWRDHDVPLWYTSKLFPCLDQLLAKHGY